MTYVFIAVLVLVVVVFGVSSVMQSFASAQQAQASIESSKTAQVLAVNQTINTLVIGLVILLLVGIVAALVMYGVRRQQMAAYPRALPQKRAVGRLPDTTTEYSFDPIDDVEYADLMQFLSDEQRNQ